MGFRGRGRKSEVGSRKSEVGGRKSEVRSQKSEVRGKKSEVRGKKSEVRGKGPRCEAVHSKNTNSLLFSSARQNTASPSALIAETQTSSSPASGSR
jgi:hypothetical protein